MDGSRLRRICDKLGIENFESLDQNQFDGLMASLNMLDRETVRSVIERIPDLADKIGTYFTNLQMSFQLTSGKDYLDAMRDQQQLLMGVLEKEEDPRLRERIADELLRHSQWLREQSKKTDFFKKVITVVGLAATFILLRSLQADMKYMARRAERSTERNRDSYNPGYDSYEDYRNRQEDRYDDRPHHGGSDRDKEKEYRDYDPSSVPPKEYTEKNKSREYSFQ